MVPQPDAFDPDMLFLLATLEEVEKQGMPEGMPEWKILKIHSSGLGPNEQLEVDQQRQQSRLRYAVEQGWLETSKPVENGLDPERLYHVTLAGKAYAKEQQELLRQDLEKLRAIIPFPRLPEERKPRPGPKKRQSLHGRLLEELELLPECKGADREQLNQVALKLEKLSKRPGKVNLRSNKGSVFDAFSEILRTMPQFEGVTDIDPAVSVLMEAVKDVLKQRKGIA